MQVNASGSLRQEESNGSVIEIAWWTTTFYPFVAHDSIVKNISLAFAVTQINLLNDKV